MKQDKPKDSVFTCHNILVAEGEKEVVHQLAKKLFSKQYSKLTMVPQHCALDFNQVLPMPIGPSAIKDWLDKLGGGISTGNNGHPCIPILSEQDKWCIRNWGTRFNAKYAEVTLSENALVVYFTTYWSPPNGVYQWIKQAFNQLEVVAWHCNIADALCESS